MSVKMKQLAVRFDVEAVNGSAERVIEKNPELTRSEVIRDALELGLELMLIKSEVSLGQYWK